MVAEEHREAKPREDAIEDRQGGVVIAGKTVAHPEIAVNESRVRVEVESAPKEFPHYVEGYYAAFFYDPDGIKLEVVHEPTRAATTSP